MAFGRRGIFQRASNPRGGESRVVEAEPKPAADSVVAEISPTSVPAGSTANAFTYDVKPTISGASSGVDKVTITVPAAFGVPTVTDVKVDDVSKAYTDNTSGRAISVTLTAKVVATSKISVLFTADAPGSYDATGVDFTSTIDDTSTPTIDPVATTEGDADGVADDDTWTVTTSFGAANDIDTFTRTQSALDPLSAAAGCQSFCFLEGGNTLVIADLGAVYEWPLSTPYDVTTTGTRATTDCGAQNWTSIHQNPEATGYVSAWRGYASTDVFHTWNTASGTTLVGLTNAKSKGVADAPRNSLGGHWTNAAGTVMIVADRDGARLNIRQYNMSTPWDASTAGLQGSPNFSYSAQISGGADDLTFSPDGTQLYLCDGVNDKIFQYDCSTPFDLSTASYSGKALSLQPRDYTNICIRFSEDSTQFWAMYGGNGAPLFDLYTTNGGDEYFSSVVLLLDFAGSDGATNITDLSDSAHVDTFNGNAEVDTALQVLSKNSALFDGSGDSITFPDSADWDFSGDFTIEMHVRSPDFGTNTYAFIANQSATKGWRFRYNNNKLEFDLWAGTLKTEAWSPSNDTWYHIAVVKASGSFYLFVDGTQLGTPTANASDLTGSDAVLSLGIFSSTLSPFNGSIANVRVTKGVARYTQNFVAPSIFYPTSGV